MKFAEFHAGQLIQAGPQAVIEARRSRTQATLGILRWRWQRFNTRGAEVLDLEATSLFDLSVTEPT